MIYLVDTLNARKSSVAAPSAGIKRFMNEVSLIFGLVGLVLWVASLLSYSQQDAAWSTSGSPEVLAGTQVMALNWFGHLGAWLADASYFLLGFSVWWAVAAAFQVWLIGLVRQFMGEPPASDVSPRARRIRFWLGLVLLLLASAVLEWSRLYRFEALLPGHAGGVIGYMFGSLSVKLLGFAGSGLVFIVLGVMAVAHVFNFSWARVAVAFGTRIDGLITLRREKRELAQDLKMGQQAARQREEILIDERLDSEQHHQPIIIKSPVVELFKSMRPAKAQAQAQTQAQSGAQASPAPQVPVPASAPKTAVAPAPASAAAPVPAPKTAVAAPRPPRLDAMLPQVSLLDPPPLAHEGVALETLEMTSRLIEKKLKDFGVEVRVVAAAPGPVITRYEIEPATGVKGSQVVTLAKDLARALSLISIRVIETIPGKNFMALELPNAKRQSIRLSEILGSQAYADASSLLTIGLGKDIAGHAIVADLAKMPHCLVAGTTGSGKSVGINAMILSLLFKADPRDVRLLLIDPKMLEMSVYEGIPHLLAPVVTDMKQAAHGLNWCVAEMEKRYKLMSKLGVRNLAGYNAKIDEATGREAFIYNPFSLTPEEPEPLERLPYIVVVIDELADLMMVVGKKIEELIARLAQKARAAGIHLVLATQRPSVDVITGLIKANIPTRLSFQVSSKIDSRTILDQMGAEALLGMGDMLYMPSGTGFPIRVHGAFVSDEEVHRVVAYLKAQAGEPNYIEGVLEGGTVDGGASGTEAGASGEKDPMYDQAVEVVLKNRRASISLVQRHLKIGYNRAARLVEEMENAGLVSAMSGSGQREILVPARAE